jgi:rhodanese-related sulfurtransferase
MPWDRIPANPTGLLDLCKQNETVYVMCRRGNASKETTNFLLNHGVTNCINVEGGMNALSLIDEKFPLY